MDSSVSSVSGTDGAVAVVSDRLVVRINGAAILATVVENPNAKDGCGYLRDYDISLEPWVGQDVTIELMNEPTGWSKEAAVWKDLLVTANSGLPGL